MIFMCIHSHTHPRKGKAYQVTQSGLSEFQKCIFFFFKKRVPKDTFYHNTLIKAIFDLTMLTYSFPFNIKFYISVCHCSPFFLIISRCGGNILSLGAYFNIFKRFSSYSPGVKGWETKSYGPCGGTGSIQVLSNYGTNQFKRLGCQSHLLPKSGCKHAGQEAPRSTRAAWHPRKRAWLQVDN